MTDTPQTAGQSAMVHLDESNFKSVVEGASTPVMVDFYADWCGPCKMAAPVLEKLAKEFNGQLTIGKVNVDEAGALAQQFGVMSIPTVVIFHKKDGKVTELDRKVGFPGEPGYRQMITQAVTAA